MTQSEAIDKLYSEIAEDLDITVRDVRIRSTQEPLVQRYYEWKYNWDLNDDTTIPF